MKDLQVWSGLTRLQPSVDALRAESVTYRDEQGRELFDVPGAPLPSAAVPATMRFLPDFDNLVHGYQDRQRIIAERHRSYVFPGNSMVLPTFLVDGFVQGVWKIERTKTGAKLLIQPFEPLADTARQELREEGERLMQWVTEKVTTWEMAFVEYGGNALGQNLWGRL